MLLRSLQHAGGPRGAAHPDGGVHFGSKPEKHGPKRSPDFFSNIKSAAKPSQTTQSELIGNQNPGARCSAGLSFVSEKLSETDGIVQIEHNHF